MDIFTEQIVKRKFNGKDWLICLGASVAAFVLIYISIFILLPLTMMPLIPLLVIAGCIYGIYWVYSFRNLEFEYSVTNGDLTIDRIINRQRRKRVISFDCKDVEAIGKYKAVDHQSKHYDKKFFTSMADDGSDEGAWYIAVRSPKYGGFCLVVFHPEERVLDSIRPFLPRQLAFEVFGPAGRRKSSDT